MKSIRFLITLSVILPLVLITGCGIISNGKTNKISESSFSYEEIDLITEKNIGDPFRVLKTDNKTDSLILRSKSSDVNPLRDRKTIEILTKRMYSTVTDSASLGVGIAAPQIGILKNVILVQRFDKDGSPFEIYLNPVIIQHSNMKQDCREGCLSVPETRGTTKTRAYAILLKYQKPDNSTVMEMVEGFTAVIFQHEIDHLNGALFFDYL